MLALSVTTRRSAATICKMASMCALASALASTAAPLTICTSSLPSPLVLPTLLFFNLFSSLLSRSAGHPDEHAKIVAAEKVTKQGDKRIFVVNDEIERIFQAEKYTLATSLLKLSMS
jgi:hypothetical protein